MTQLGWYAVKKNKNNQPYSSNSSYGNQTPKVPEGDGCG